MDTALPLKSTTVESKLTYKHISLELRSSPRLLFHPRNIAGGTSTHVCVYTCWSAEL